MKWVIKEEYLLRNQLLQLISDNEWSDLFITVWSYPIIKVWGELTPINEGIEKMTWRDTMDFAQSVLSEKQHNTLVKTRNLDFAFSFSWRRFRWNVSFQMWNYMLVFRLLSWKIPSIEDLNLPWIFKEVTKRWQWLVLVTWPTGSWKSTTLAAMIDYINRNYAKHIITIEDPVEYIHKHKKSLIEQKEIWKDILDYKTALAWAMRQAPNVILFWEMRTPEEIWMALTLAETGHLVFSTLHTRSAHQTLSRVIDSFDTHAQNQVRMQLADILVWIFSQRLLKWKQDWKVHMVKEILINTTAISNMIRENDLHQIPSIMQMWSREWMQLLEKDLIELIQEWVISEEEWIKYSNNPKTIKESL